MYQGMPNQGGERDGVIVYATPQILCFNIFIKAYSW